jgi:hypothetical protein
VRICLTGKVLVQRISPYCVVSFGLFFDLV